MSKPEERKALVRDVATALQIFSERASALLSTEEMKKKFEDLRLEMANEIVQGLRRDLS